MASEQARPAKIAVQPDEEKLTSQEKLKSLGPNADDKEIVILCLGLRKDHVIDSVPSELRQRCARAILDLAEDSDSADKWISLATEFGATPAAVARAERSAAASRSKRARAGAASGGAEGSRSAAINDESYASPDDIRQARQFLESLPAACSRSRASASRDGTVTIRVLCEGANKSMDGSIKIKNGIVTEVQ